MGWVGQAELRREAVGRASSLGAWDADWVSEQALSHGLEPKLPRGIHMDLTNPLPNPTRNKI